MVQDIMRIDDVIRDYSAEAWQRQAAIDALAQVGVGRDFPCVFATQAAARGGFRFCFAADAEGSNMASGLRTFLREAHDIGPYAALFYIFAPEALQSLESYRKRFWQALARLHAADERDWPETVPEDMSSSDWTFCFDGEPVFPLCLTPAHVKKRTRHARNFTISFQPRWTFKHHLPNMDIMQKYSSLIQKKMLVFDESPVSPYLGLYGAGYLDAHKYFFHDDNLPVEIPGKLND